MKNTYEGRNLKGGFEIKINFSSSVHGERTIINGHPSAGENKFGAKKKYRCPLQGTSSSTTDGDATATDRRSRSLLHPLEYRPPSGVIAPRLSGVIFAVRWELLSTDTDRDAQIFVTQTMSWDKWPNLPQSRIRHHHVVLALTERISSALSNIPPCLDVQCRLMMMRSLLLHKCCIMP